MPTLHLGVVDQPYAYPPGKGGKPSAAKGTGDVADILEAKYHVMEHFLELHLQDVADALGESLVGALESAMMGAPEQDPYASLGTGVKDLFSKFLLTGEVEALGYPGIPTGAALRGVNHRMLHPYARRDARVSFIDTGLYESSFTAWVEPT